MSVFHCLIQCSSLSPKKVQLLHLAFCPTKNVKPIIPHIIVIVYKIQYTCLVDLPKDYICFSFAKLLMVLENNISIFESLHQIEANIWKCILTFQ